MGSLTLTTTSDLPQTKSASPTISAPAFWYSASRKPDCVPACVSMSTLWPASVSSFTPAGVTPTRASLSLISLGTPTIMADSFPASLLGSMLPGMHSTQKANIHRTALVLIWHDLRPVRSFVRGDRARDRGYPPAHGDQSP